MGAAVVDWGVEEDAEGALKGAVPVRRRPRPMTWMVVPGFGMENWAPIVVWVSSVVFGLDAH